MARTKTTARSDKKQKLVLAGCGVLLLLLAAIQGPKLLKQLNPPAPAPVAAPATSTPAPPTSPARPARAAVVPGGTSTTLVAGIPISAPAAAAPGEGQLYSFSLFTSKDPFVPQVAETAPGAGTPPAGTTPPATNPTPSKPPAASTPPPSPPSAVPGAGSSSTPPPAAAPPPAYATMLVNGSSQALALKDKFPRSDPLFVLVRLEKKVAKVGVAGGTFASGSTIALQLGSPVTVVNDATGARYVMELVYTGASPEQVATFTAPATTPAPAPAKK